MIIILLVLIVGIVIFYNLKQKDDITIADDQQSGSLSGLSMKEIEDLMNHKVDESMFSISINTAPTFENGSSAGNLRIENSPENNYLMVVKLVMEDGTLIYESGAITPAHYIEYATLDRKLDKGEYSVMAHFEAYDMETKEYIGKSACEIILHIMN